MPSPICDSATCVVLRSHRGEYGRFSDASKSPCKQTTTVIKVSNHLTSDKDETDLTEEFLQHFHRPTVMEFPSLRWMADITTVNQQA